MDTAGRKFGWWGKGRGDGGKPRVKKELLTGADVGWLWEGDGYGDSIC